MAHPTMTRVAFAAAAALLAAGLGSPSHAASLALGSATASLSFVCSAPCFIDDATQWSDAAVIELSGAATAPVSASVFAGPPATLDTSAQSTVSGSGIAETRADAVLTLTFGNAGASDLVIDFVFDWALMATASVSSPAVEAASAYAFVSLFDDFGDVTLFEDVDSLFGASGKPEGTLTFALLLGAGERNTLSLDAGASAYAISAIPLPAPALLLGAALPLLPLVARRRRA